MSDLSNAFLELVRQAHARLRQQPAEAVAAAQQTPARHMYCADCGKQTPHTLFVNGDWEHFVCQLCHRVQDYRVR